MSMILSVDIAVLKSFNSGDSCDILLHKQLPSADGCRLLPRILPSETLSLFTAAFSLTYPAVVAVRNAYWHISGPSSGTNIKFGLLLR
jgi:hypothetical protein